MTFQRLELLSKETNWFTNPPQVRLNVRAKEPVTPQQANVGIKQRRLSPAN
ncbi:hypothetical protein QH73_0015685 [Scytonema millei VB511283]|uniref:Uncharacterized protein n=2 Tax=Scytonema TaxID=1203 RepID=A0A9X5E6H0_9CYAN|nr:hypothetical protein [Scytonema millei VB511283]